MPWEDVVNTVRQGRQRNLIDLVEPPFDRKALDEDTFRRVIAIERKRTERSKAPFVLMLLEIEGQHAAKATRALDSGMAVLLATSRDTDLVGWYESKHTIGVLFTGLMTGDKSAILTTILSRVSKTLREELTFEQFNLVKISLHYYPDDWDEKGSGRPSNPALYPDISSRDKGKQPMLIVKRMIDIVAGSILAIICMPFCLIIAIAIKATSKGPILFRQMRVGSTASSSLS